MKFDYQEYYKMLFVGSLVVIIVVASLLVVCSISFLKNNVPMKVNSSFGGYILNIIVLLFFLSTAIFPMKHGIYLIREKETDIISNAGIITNIAKTYGINKYSYDDHTVFASYIYIDNEQYYIMYIGDLQIGDEVTFEYLPKSRIILGINEK